MMLAGGAAIVLVGSVAEVTADTVDVTFVVAAEPMSLTLGPDVEFADSVTIGVNAETMVSSASTKISFTNPASQSGSARILVERTAAPDLKNLSIQFGVALAGAGENYDRFNLDYRGSDGDERTLVSGIAQGTSVVDKNVEFALVNIGGDDGHGHTEAGSVTSTFAFTIEQEPAED